MPELLLELFSEEIPARMQARAATDLARLVTEVLTPLNPTALRPFAGPRRIALAAQLDAAIPARHSTERGPRASAPAAAIDGFLRKHGADRSQLRQEGDYWLLDIEQPGITAAQAIAAALPGLLRRFPWQKSMRWGRSALTWVRPLRRILCILDGALVPFALADGTDDAHGLRSDTTTEGHRFLAPGAFTVGSSADWQAGLRARRVIVDAAERRQLIQDGLLALAARHSLQLVDDPGLLDEVAGLVEWPVPLLGRIDDAFMDLPPEVMQVSMRVNQRYFALRDMDGRAAPFFAFAANVEAPDGGAAIIAGNERVLRARFADARHFWDLDRKQTLESRLPGLDRILFHLKLGTQGARAERLAGLASTVADAIGGDPALAARAGRLAKTDLVTGMVGEFPELQGVMGGYYALNDGEPCAVADAIRHQYAPRQADFSTTASRAEPALAIADRLDQLAGFFSIGEKPTGSGDPFALRRAALQIIAIVTNNDWPLALRPLIAEAARPFGGGVTADDVFAFLQERLRAKLRSEGARHDVLNALMLSDEVQDDFTQLLKNSHTLTAFLAQAEGKDLLTFYRRAYGIVAAEEKRDSIRFDEQAVDERLFAEPEGEEEMVRRACNFAETRNADCSPENWFATRLTGIAGLRPAMDRFFDRILVNDPNPRLRENRLRLLRRVVNTMDRFAKFSEIADGS